MSIGFRSKWLRTALILGAMLLAATALGACASSSPSVGDRVVATYGSFENLPLTAQEARQAGWVEPPGECVPNMGRHFLRMAGGQPGPMVLLYDTQDKLIGVELESLSEQPAPPWEHLSDGHPGMEFEHWTIHFWFSDPAKACAS